MRSASRRLPGHPDEICDLVAEAIVDEYMRRDPASRLRISAQGGRGVMFVSGDILSQADFDVSALVRRTVGSLGVTDDLEPFIALEPVTAERVAAFRLPNEIPVTVTGYASAETDLFLPPPVVRAARVASALKRLREEDADAFWLGPDAEGTALVDASGKMRVSLRVEHGAESLDRVRAFLADRLAPSLEGASLDVNPAGPCEKRGLASASGSSHRVRDLYGSALPSTSVGIGSDPMSAEKAGTWLARAAAIRAVKSGAQAALVTATYLPGEFKPVDLRIRDERGRDISSSVSLEQMSLERVSKEWIRPNLSTDAVRGGIVLDPSLPWNS
jgi:S-adenosylmethionine synthetase